VDALSGLGCRIGELLALDWTKIDTEAGTLSIEGTVIRVPGKGLIVQPHTKSKAGMRTIHPPEWVLDLFRRRHADALGEWIFRRPGSLCAIRTTPGPGCAMSCGGRRGRACTRTRTGTWSPLGLTGLGLRGVAPPAGLEPAA
jgi:integrase